MKEENTMVLVDIWLKWFVAYCKYLQEQDLQWIYSYLLIHFPLRTTHQNSVCKLNFEHWDNH